MAPLTVDDLHRSLADAARESAGLDWETLKHRAIPELRKLAEIAMEVERRKIDGDTSEEQAATLMRMHMMGMRRKMFEIDGVASSTMEIVFDTVNHVLRQAVYAATGWKGF